MTPYATQLREVPGLEECSRADLERLARTAERVVVAAGDTVTGRDDRWTGSCIIERGEAVVRIGGWTFLLPAGARVVRSDPAAVGIDVVARRDVDAIVVGRGFHRQIPALGV